MKKFSICFSMILVSMLWITCSEDEGDMLPPQEVANLIATAGDKKVTLSWEVPADRDLKEYVITFSPDGITTTLSKDSLVYVVSQLTNNVEYTFTVKTKDMTGNLSPGASVSVTPFSEEETNPTRFTGNLELISQAQIDQFNESYTYFEGDLVITGADITDLSPFHNLDTISGKLEIYFTEALANLNAFSKLKYVGGNIYIRGNNALVNVDSLHNLVFVGKDLSLLDNNLIANLDGLKNLESVEGSIYIGVEAWKSPPKARGNNTLADFCGLKKLLSGNGLKGSLFIENNAANPPREAIIACTGSIDQTPPAEVGQLTAQASDKEIIVRWQAPGDADLKGYELSYTPSGLTVTVNKGQLGDTLTGLTNGTEYTLTVKAVDFTGNKSAGKVTTATPLDNKAPGKVTAFTVTAGDRQVVLDWTNPADADLKELVFNYSPGGSELIIDKSSQAYTVTGLTNGTEYTFTLKTRDNAGNTSDAVSGKGTPESSDNTPPAEVGNLASATDDGMVKLTWTKPGDGDLKEYRLTYSPGGNAPITIAKTEEQYTVSGLANGTAYTFTIKTVDNEGNISSGASRAATPNIPRVTYNGDLYITSQAQLDALPKYYTTITGRLQLSGADITDLSKLSRLDSIKSRFEIINCTSLTSLAAFSKLKYVGHNFYLQNNPNVTSLEGLHNLVTIVRDIVILQMTGITSLDGLRNVEKGRSLYIGVEGWLASPPADKGNTQLSNFCGLKKLMTGTGFAGPDFKIQYNASNPTKQDIVNCP